MHNIVKILNTTKQYVHLKMVKMVNFILYVFYYIVKHSRRRIGPKKLADYYWKWKL